MLNQIIQIVKNASKLMNTTDFEVTLKGTESNVVSSIDIAVEKYLREQLMPLFPDTGFIGEECEASDFDHTYLWVVDPIDGTKNFVRGLKSSCISVGLLKDKEPYMGVIYNPYLDELYSAEKGKGAFLNGTQIHVSDKNLPSSLFCTAMSLYNKSLAPYCFHIIEKVYPDCDDIRRIGSAAIELALLASGRVDLYFEIRVFPWDIAAGILLIREAGGFIGTIDYDQFPVNRPVPVFAANTKENFEYLQKIILEEIPHIPYEN
ncbi:MAG: inositol monophosphatase family protein [Lachnospiraceae bacterium]|nr:inositol monophosphatase family protein [Lachnospiraceae bacterium]